MFNIFNKQLTENLAISNSNNISKLRDFVKNFNDKSGNNTNVNNSNNNTNSNNR